jgi:hypothetical protein
MQLHQGPELAKSDNRHIIHCRKCEYAHLVPMPDALELAQLYQDEYYQKHNAGWFDKERREFWYCWMVR